MKISMRRNPSIPPLSIVAIGVILLCTTPALAQEGSGALGDIIIDSLVEFIRRLTEPIAGKIEQFGSDLVEIITATPHPNAVFTEPTNGAWPRLYDYYWQTIVPLSLSLWGLAIGLIIILETTSHLFSSYHRSKLKKRAFTGLLGILSWWWLAAISLRFMNALTGVLAPSLSNISLFETASFTGMGVLGLAISLGVDFTLFVLLAVIYLARQVVLYLFVLWMPVLIAMWIPGVGPFAMLSKLVRKLAGFYLPFLIMTLPVAILFQLGKILGHSFGLSMGGIGAWLTAIIIPFIAVLSPIVLIWQAGGIFFIGDRIARHASAQRAQRRVSGMKAKTQTAAHGSRNFVRGARGKPAVRQNGQTMLDSGDSRAHATGARVSSSGGRLRGTVRSDGGTPIDSRDASPARSTDFTLLRDR